MGRLALRAIVREADGRGPATMLTPRVLAHFGAAKPEELLQTVYHGDFKPAEVAALATHVQHARDAGDAVASAILDRGAQELVAAAASVTKQLDLGADAFAFVLSGGMFKAVPWLRDELTRRLPAVAPLGRTLVLDAEPAFGAVRLALAELAGGAAIPKYR
jgi:N-acetylglucosamine kinase-like BadF-type ATPase